MENLVIYQNGEIELKVSIENETIWLKAEDIASLFDVQRPAIVKHIGNIYKTNELVEFSTCSILEQVAKDGKKRKIKYYNLDIIISIGYRVNSIKATSFRQWATSVLKNYISNGYAINSEKITHQRFKELESDIDVLKLEMKDIKSKVKNDILEYKSGIFYDGQTFDAYVFVSEIIKSAKNSIILIDNYIDESVLMLLTKRASTCKATIFTKTISKQLQLDLKKHNKQYLHVEIKKFESSHDRFLIIDDVEIYHIGASLKDLGKKWFGFSKMDSESFEMMGKLK